MELPNRKCQRLKNYDYSNEGYYFVTICTKNKEKLFCSILYDDNGEAIINYTGYGVVVEKHLQKICVWHNDIKIDKYVIMPNHIHIIFVIGCNGETERSRPFPTLSTIVGLFKSGVSREIGVPIWQKSFHDHIIRDEKGYLKIWEYIDNNPLTWKNDCFFD